MKSHSFEFTYSSINPYDFSFRGLCFKWSLFFKNGSLLSFCDASVSNPRPECIKCLAVLCNQIKSGTARK